VGCRAAKCIRNLVVVIQCAKDKFAELQGLTANFW